MSPLPPCLYHTIKSVSPSLSCLNELRYQTIRQLEKIHIPVWLLVSGCAVFFVPGIYFIYDKYCKDEHGGPWIKSAANCIVIFYLLCGLSWSVVGKFIHSG